jgi:hypothetical protein
LLKNQEQQANISQQANASTKPQIKEAHMQKNNFNKMKKIFLSKKIFYILVKEK